MSHPHDDATPEERRALFRVVRGAPTVEELAALTVTLAAVGGGGTPAPPPPSAWADRTPQLRTALRPGPGAWRTSAWPR